MHRNSPVYLFEAWPIGNEPAILDRLLASEHAGEPVLRCKLRNLRTMPVGYGVWEDKQSIGFLLEYRIEGRGNVRCVFYCLY